MTDRGLRHRRTTDRGRMARVRADHGAGRPGRRRGRGAVRRTRRPACRPRSGSSGSARPGPARSGRPRSADDDTSVRAAVRTRPWAQARARVTERLGAAGWSRHWAATGARTWQLLTDRIVTPLRTRLGTELDEQGLPAARLALLDAVHGQHDGAWLGAFDGRRRARRAGRGGPQRRLVVAVRADGGPDRAPGRAAPGQPRPAAPRRRSGTVLSGRLGPVRVAGHADPGRGRARAAAPDGGADPGRGERRGPPGDAGALRLRPLPARQRRGPGAPRRDAACCGGSTCRATSRWSWSRWSTPRPSRTAPAAPTSCACRRGRRPPARRWPGRSGWTRRSTPRWPRRPQADALQHPAGEHVVQRQPLQVHVPDVAVADGVGARPRSQRGQVRAVVEVAQRLGDEVAAAHRAVAVDRDHRLAGPAARGRARRAAARCSRSAGRSRSRPPPRPRRRRGRRPR